jgi:4a-hydroxytetrahydrobiopterin dehydratase
MKQGSKKLKLVDIEKQLLKLSDWKLNAKQTELTRVFAFPSFITALSFVAKVTVHAEVMGHHPVVELSYGKVKIKLSTEDVSGLTKADFELAKKIDALTLN